MRERHLVRIPAVIALTAIILAVTSMSGCTTKQLAPEITNVQLLVGPSTVPVQENSTFAAVVTVTGGTAPFSYVYAGTPTWHSTGSSATEELSWPTPGKHYITCAVTVTDANGKTGSATTMLEVTVTAPPVFIQKDLPDISAETTVPLILEVHGKNAQYLLAAWQPEKGTLEIGEQPVGTADAQPTTGAYFTRVPGTRRLLWWSGDIYVTAVEDLLGLKSWNGSIVTPLTSFPVSGSAVWWWSGHDSAITTVQRGKYVTSEAPSASGYPPYLIVSDSSGKTCTIDLSHELVGGTFEAQVLAAHGDLQDGFVLLQGGDQKLEREYVLLVRFQNGEAQSRVVARDSHYDSKDINTWLRYFTSDPPVWAYVGTTLYLLPRVDNATVYPLWTLDISAAVPTLRRYDTLGDLGALGSYPMACGPYLLLHDHNGDVVAIRDGKVVGRLHISGTTLSTDAGGQSMTRRIRNLYQVHLPNAADLNSFFFGSP
jgi:hypothetical protein